MLENAPEVLAALRTVAAFLEELGIPGLVALVLIGPVLMALASFALDFLRQRHARQEDEARRREGKADRELMRELIEQARKETAALEERHRAETAAILRDLGAKHAEVSQFYKDNVELLKTTQRLAIDMRDIMISNTRAFERLTNALEANFYCPIVRERATGKK